MAMGHGVTPHGDEGLSAGTGRRRHAMMSEINVTPMVDVMLVLLIIFMVSAPLLTVGVPIDLPQTKAKSLDQDKEPLVLSVNDNGKVFLQDNEISIDDLVTKLQAITAGSWRLRGAHLCARRPQGGLRHRDARDGSLVGGGLPSGRADHRGGAGFLS